jgi:Flp pilus assembly protein TadD
MQEPRRCQACGAKVRDGRVKCTRCDASLEHAAPAAPGRRLSTRWTAAVVAGFAVCGALAWAFGSGGSPPAPARAVSTGGHALSSSRVPDDPGRTAAEGSMPAVDAANAGTAAFRDGRFADAVVLFEQAVAASPDHPEWLNNLGQALGRSGRDWEAIPYLERAVAAGPDKWTYRFNLAHARGRTGDLAGAVAAYQEADRLFPDDHVTLYNLGLALQRLGRDGEALAPLERAVALDPSDPGFVLALAQSYVRTSRRDDAARSFERYLELAPSGADAAAARDALALLRAAPAEPPAQPAEPPPVAQDPA